MDSVEALVLVVTSAGLGRLIAMTVVLDLDSTATLVLVATNAGRDPSTETTEALDRTDSTVDLVRVATNADRDLSTETTEALDRMDSTADLGLVGTIADLDLSTETTEALDRTDSTVDLGLVETIAGHDPSTETTEALDRTDSTVDLVRVATIADLDRSTETTEALDRTDSTVDLVRVATIADLGPASTATIADLDRVATIADHDRSIETTGVLVLASTATVVGRDQVPAIEIAVIGRIIAAATAPWVENPDRTTNSRPSRDRFTFRISREARLRMPHRGTDDRPASSLRESSRVKLARNQRRAALESLRVATIRSSVRPFGFMSASPIRACAPAVQRRSSSSKAECR